MRNKALIYMVILFLISIVTFFIVNKNHQEKIDNLTHNKYLSTSDNIKKYIEQSLIQKKQQGLTLALSLSKNKQYIEFFENPSNKIELTSLTSSLKQYTNQQNVWIHLVSYEGISLYRSWAKKKGDNVAKIRKELPPLLKDPKPTNLISVGIFDLSFKSIVPVYNTNNKFVGIVEVITKINSITDNLKTIGHDPVVLVDKKYKKQIKKPFTKKFVNDYYVANTNADSKYLNFLNSNTKNYLQNKEYRIHDDKLILTYSVKDIFNDDMAYIIIFEDLNTINTDDIKNFDTFIKTLGIFILVLLVVILITIYFYNRSKYANELEEKVEERTKEIQEVQNEIKELNKELQKKVEARTADLKVAKEKAESANKAKSIFLSNMSHELRTPLNAVLGFSQLMSGSNQLNNIEKGNLKIINRSGNHLLQLINDVLDMSKIEAGKTTLELENIDLGNMTNDVIDMMKVRAEVKDLDLFLEQTSEFPRFIQCDAAKLRQILINLLSNAIKFTKEGEVSLRLDAKEEADENITLNIEVKDTGIGIDQENIQKIFLPFEQLVESVDQKGTGLGLAITKQFIELMGGEINVESRPGHGSKFSFYIKVKRVPESSIIIDKSLESETRNILRLKDPTKQWRILIVEDQADNQILLTQLLERVGFTSKIASNGQEAIDMFKEWKPHFIWMDIRMPVMDGIEATKIIRSLPDGDKIIISALTASVFRGEENNVISAGCDDFVRKPYRNNEIYECLAKHLGIEYIYEDIKQEDQTAYTMNNDEILEAMKKLDSSVVEELKKAAEEFNDDKLHNLIQDIEKEDSRLAENLRLKLENFDYKVIQEITQRLING